MSYALSLLMFFFFFSSRRRHTRFKCDWSSDVCSSDLLSEIRSVSSHPMALAQCERFFGQHPSIKRLPAEDTAGSVREMLARGDRTHAAIAGKYAADRYRG